MKLGRYEIINTDKQEVVGREPDPPKKDKIKTHIAYVASFLVLGVFLGSEPARHVYNWTHDGASVVFNEHWFSTLLNLTLLAFGVLIGKEVSEHDRQRQGRYRRRPRRGPDDCCPTCGQLLPHGGPTDIPMGIGE